MKNTIKSLLGIATKNLTKSPSPAIDAELLLMHVLNTKRSYLYTYPEMEINADQDASFLKLITRRQTGEPIAYILGEKEFWSLSFKVTPDTLIPRPETELLVELALQKLPADVPLNVADLGTGSGAIALSLAHERHNWQIYATDHSAKALKIAEENSQHLKINNVRFSQGEWCDALPKQPKFAAIISNPPYIAKHEPHLQQGDLRFEPQSALVSGEEGLQDIRLVIQQARNYLAPEGLIILEHGYRQAAQVRHLLRENGFTDIESLCDLQGHERAACAKIIL